MSNHHYFHQEGRTDLSAPSSSKGIVHLPRLGNEGKAEARLLLGQIYCFGKGVPKDERLGFDWIRKSAEQGNALAQFNLGSLTFVVVSLRRHHPDFS